MTASIQEILATLPSGEKATTLTLEEVGRYLGERCNGDEAKAREQRHRLRDELYTDGGVQYMKRVIDEVFVDPEIKELRKKWVKHARYNNAYKRIVNEGAQLYAAPAKRAVEGEENNAAYQLALKEMQFDVVMQHVNRLFGAHRVLICAPRVRTTSAGELEPVVDIATPSQFRVVLHPNDNSLVVGWLVRTEFRPARGLTSRQPAWTLWTNHERVMLDDRMHPIESTYTDKATSRWVPITRLPNRAGFFPGEEGEDLVACAVAIWLNEILLMKETKTANKQTVVSGDGTGTARGQVMDSEMPIELSDGQAMTTVDTGMDLSIFRSNSEHAMTSTANNYGMSAAYLKHQGVQSAEAREMMRVPLRELRREQEPPFRLFESKFAVKLSEELRAYGPPEMRFTPDGWSINFSESQTPLTPREELELFEKERKATVTNTVEFLMRRDPDITEEQAKARIVRNLDMETWRIELMRGMQALSGGVTESVEGQAPPQTPQQEPTPAQASARSIAEEVLRAS